MFTGITTDIGTVVRVGELDHGRRLRVETGKGVADVDIGASIAHSGTCLTVVAKSDDPGDPWYEVEAWNEALQLTTLGGWGEGTRCNVERSLKLGDELGGHLVLGHVDGTAEIIDQSREGEAVRFTLVAPEPLARFIAPKGSVCLDGVSLTVNGVDGSRFDVLLIAHTLKVTTWGERQAGDRVNIEVDQMARYAARLAQFPADA